MRRAAARRPGCASARTSRRTCAAGPSGSRSTASRRRPRARRSRASARTRRARRSSRCSRPRRSPSSPRARSTSRSSRRASAGATTRRTCSTRAVVVLTNVALDHTDVLGDDARGDRRREARGRRARAPSSSSASRSGRRPRARPARRASSRSSGSNLALAVAAAEALLGRARRPARGRGACACPGRLERRGERPLEIWDGAHNLAGRRLPARAAAAPALHDRRLDPRRQERRRDAAGADGRRRHARRDARRRTPARLPAEELAALAAPHFARVEAVADPPPRSPAARALAGPDGAVLVTGSLYLLAELSAVR